MLSKTLLKGHYCVCHLSVHNSSTWSLLCLSLLLSKTLLQGHYCFCHLSVHDFSTGSLLCLSLVFSKTLLQGHYCFCHLSAHDFSNGHYCVSHLCFPRLFYRVITVYVTFALQDCSTESLLCLSLATIALLCVWTVS